MVQPLLPKAEVLPACRQSRHRHLGAGGEAFVSWLPKDVGVWYTSQAHRLLGLWLQSTRLPRASLVRVERHLQTHRGGGGTHYEEVQLLRPSKKNMVGTGRLCGSKGKPFFLLQLLNLIQNCQMPTFSASGSPESRYLFERTAVPRPHGNGIASGLQ